MRISSTLAALALSLAAVAPAAAQSATKIQVGVLSCKVAPSVGFVLGSVREMTCELKSGPVGSMTVQGRYAGKVTRFGIDLGFSGPGVLSWGVFAPTTAPSPVNLAGSYVGVSADAAWGVGAGANVLLGGSNKTIALQPLSVEGATGMAIAAGVADLTLTPM